MRQKTLRRRHLTNRPGVLLMLLRRVYGMTARELAETLCVQPETVCRWEARGMTPHGTSRARLAAIFSAPELGQRWPPVSISPTVEMQRQLLPALRAALARAGVTVTEEALHAAMNASYEPRE